jgi:hypothetical protein
MKPSAPERKLGSSYTERSRAKAAPEGSSGFACWDVGLFDLRLAKDDLGAVEREIIELHVETPTVAVDPGSAYRLPETALTVLGHGVNSVARGVGCLAHVMCLSSWFESHAPCAASWGTRPARKAARFKGGLQGTGKRRGVGREPKATETSGLEDDAREGISPTNSKPLVLALRSKGTSTGATDALIQKTRSRPSTGVEGAGQDLAAAIISLEKGYGLRLVK